MLGTSLPGRLDYCARNFLDSMVPQETCCGARPTLSPQYKQYSCGALRNDGMDGERRGTPALQRIAVRYAPVTTLFLGTGIE